MSRPWRCRCRAAWVTRTILWLWLLVQFVDKWGQGGWLLAASFMALTWVLYDVGREAGWKGAHDEWREPVA